jgi:uncharacterized coiled-coil DUF342 family protein
MSTPNPKSKSKPGGSIADLLQDWEELLAASADNAEKIAAAEPQRLVMEELLKKARDLRARQESHRAARQQHTQEFKALRKEGEETARRLRSAVKANIGTTSELLTQFKVAPIRPRPRKAKATGETPPTGPTPEPAPPTVKAAEPATEGDQQ